MINRLFSIKIVRQLHPAKSDLVLCLRSISIFWNFVWAQIVSWTLNKLSFNSGLRKNLAAKFRKMCAQMPKFGRQIFLGLKCTYTCILKISDKNIEKCRRRTDSSEAHFWKYCELRYIVNFWLFFEPIIHIFAVTELEISWEMYFKPTNHIKRVLWSNIDIWPSHRPKTMKFGSHAHIWA